MGGILDAEVFHIHFMVGVLVKWMVPILQMAVWSLRREATVELKEMMGMPDRSMLAGLGSFIQAAMSTAFGPVMTPMRKLPLVASEAKARNMMTEK